MAAARRCGRNGNRWPGQIIEYHCAGKDGLEYFGAEEDCLDTA